VKALINTDMIISNHKIKAKSEILTEALDENHVTHMTHVIHAKPLGETEVGQKTTFSSKNMIIAEKIIFVLDAAI